MAGRFDGPSGRRVEISKTRQNLNINPPLSKSTLRSTHVTFVVVSPRVQVAGADDWTGKCLSASHSLDCANTPRFETTWPLFKLARPNQAPVSVTIVVGACVPAGALLCVCPRQMPFGLSMASNKRKAEQDYQSADRGSANFTEASDSTKRLRTVRPRP